jgi:hypothetical protein
VEWLNGNKEDWRRKWERNILLGQYKASLTIGKREL